MWDKDSETLYRFASNLVYYMNRLGYSQSYLSEITDISEGSISKYVNALQMPRLSTLMRLATALHCTVEELVD